VQTEIDEDLKSEIGKHMLQPENYGKLDDADAIGIGVEQSTRAYVFIYIKRDEKTILDIKFHTNGTEDAITLGSLFTNMIKGDEISNILATVLKLEQDVQESYINLPTPKVDTSKPEGEQVEKISTEHLDSANMVLTAFRAAMRHYERKLEGIEENLFEMNIAKTCPYSSNDCHFMMEENQKKIFD
jgi:nitrogen fixation NifU-like protein